MLLGNFFTGFQDRRGQCKRSADYGRKFALFLHVLRFFMYVDTFFQERQNFTFSTTYFTIVALKRIEENLDLHNSLEM